MRVKFLCAAFVAAFAISSALAQDVTFDIGRFQVEGNSLLPAARVQELVAPFVGKKRVYGDVQKALEALEGAYRKAGYGTVQVFVPEQELGAGVVRLVVTESVVGKVTLTGNQHFSEANIRNTLRALQEGKAPNMRSLSENIQLANDNPAKQVEVTLGVSEAEGKVDAKISVSDHDPQRFIVTLDNTGTPNGGRHRVGVAYQHANLFDADHALTLAVTGSPDLPSNQDMAVASVAYRLPFYSIGDSLDFAYGKSNVNSAVAQQTGLNIIGKGEVFALRWNHYLPRAGEYTSRVVFGYDYKNIETCAGPVCSQLTIQPASIAYVGGRVSAGSMLNYNISAATGTQVSTAAGASSLNFTASRFSAAYMQTLGDWAARAAFSGQYAGARLPDVEKFGVVGSNAVRGFYERGLAGDSGYFINLEAYTPDYAKQLGIPGNLKFLGFIDIGQGYNYATNLTSDAASLGIGLRYGIDRNIAFKADIAQVVGAGPTLVGVRKEALIGSPEAFVGPGDVRGHFALQISF